ncbi:MAG: cysteine hydrolase family protein [Gemmatimonadaceae bacterium]
MPAKNNDLHGNAPENCPVALLMVDVINDLEFEDGAKVLKQALPAAKRLAALAKRARSAGIPVIYANDNFGKWRSDFRQTVEHCCNNDVRGRPIAELLKPEESDYFVLKPKHSGFFSTTLETLLKYLETETLILAGIATDMCLLFTASDAHMRDYHLIVPDDCSAAATSADHNRAIELMKSKFEADTTPSDELDLQKMLTPAST